jgi:hypothetical protein
MQRYQQQHRSKPKSKSILKAKDVPFEDIESAYFTHISSTDDLSYSYNSSDVTVIENLELPLSVPYSCGGILKYKFSTIHGHIEFGALFENSVGDVKILHDIALVSSDGQIVEGELRVDSGGVIPNLSRLNPNSIPTRHNLTQKVIYLIWENSFSWMSKKLTYSIELFVPVFTHSDFIRASISSESYRVLGFETKVSS